MSRVLNQSPENLRRAQVISLAVGVVALIGCLIGAIFNAPQFFRSYLMAYVFWISLATGCLGILMMQHLTGGGWGLILRRSLESAARTLPLMALLFVPVLLGLHSLYVWTHAAEVAADPVLQHKHVYLNVPFFIIRTVIYFVLWGGAALLLNRWSLQQDRTAEARFSLRMQRLSGPGLFLLAVTTLFAMTDWVMSLEPRWYSTIYGVIFLAGQGLAAFAFSITVVILMADREPLASVIDEQQLRRLANLLLTFVLLWAYTSFSQFLLIWSGNLREEIPWYVRRLSGGWRWVALTLVVLHFFLPFLLLLFRKFKDRGRRLAALALFILLMRFVDIFWLVEPAYYRTAFRLHWMDVLAPLGIGGVWMAVFLWQLRLRPLLPLNDPYAAEAFGHE